jgi:hypothetical protein
MGWNVGDGDGIEVVGLGVAEGVEVGVTGSRVGDGVGVSVMDGVGEGVSDGVGVMDTMGPPTRLALMKRMDDVTVTVLGKRTWYGSELEELIEKSQ